MNAFSQFSLTVAPALDLNVLKQNYLEQTERLHPDRAQDGVPEREEASQEMAELNRAYETLKTPRLRLALVAELLSGVSAARTGRVSGPEADRMMKMAELCRKVDDLLLRRGEAQGAIEIAMLSGEIMEATQTVGGAQAEISKWNESLEQELQQVQKAWEGGERDAGRIESLSRSFSYAEKARKQLEERFLKLAESLV